MLDKIKNIYSEMRKQTHAHNTTVIITTTLINKSPSVIKIIITRIKKKSLGSQVLVLELMEAQDKRESLTKRRITNNITIMEGSTIILIVL